MTAPSAELSARRDLYTLVSRLFGYEVDAALYRRLASADAGPTPVRWLSPDLLALGEAAALTELAVDFCRLFVGPNPVCLPYAGAHQPHPTLLGATAQRFRRFLREHGLTTVWRGGGEPLAADHIAVQLAVLAHLYDQLSGDNDTERVRRTVRELVTGHLLPWAPDLAGAVSSHARCSPYRTAAAVLTELLRSEP